MINGIAAKFIAPGGIRADIVYAASAIIAFGILLGDIYTGSDIRLHILYMFPLTAVAFHSRSTGAVVAAIVLAIAFQSITFFLDGLSFVSFMIDETIAILASVLVVAMTRAARGSYLQLMYESKIREIALGQERDLAVRMRASIVDSAPYAIIATDRNGTILAFNPAAERMLWYRADEVVGKMTPERFHDPEEIRDRAKALSDEFKHPVQPGFDVFVEKPKRNIHELREWTYVRKDGSRIPVRLSVTALRGSGDALQGYLGIAYDISEQKRTEEYIRHIALHDVLTGLPNRALLYDRVAVAIAQQQRGNTTLALAMLDIDHFKHINDSMGHHIGDILLKEFASRVRGCLRPADTIARMGGDEFVLLLPDCDDAGVEAVAGRILESLAPPIRIGSQEIHITASIGISVFPRNGGNIDELLRCADVAMYWVKEHGRNSQKFFDAGMDSVGIERLRLERDLHLALENNGFVIFYQPKVDLHSKIVVGVEALLRLRTVSGRMVPPAEFIALAEETGLIVPMGEWVLETVCHDIISVQQRLGIALNVAVNVSPRQFINGNLPEKVRNVLDRFKLEASQLEFEITEGLFMDESGAIGSVLIELRSLGVGISLDDFGTGYSSLSYLKRYPISTIKIDKSFVSDVTNDEEDVALICAIIAMAHSFKIPVVAEGVETGEQLSFLAENGCDMGQGFHIARPMPLDALLQWFSTETRWRMPHR